MYITINKFYIKYYDFLFNPLYIAIFSFNPPFFILWSMTAFAHKIPRWHLMTKTNETPTKCPNRNENNFWVLNKKF